MPMPRSLERLEFWPDDPSVVVAKLETLVGARRGWCNLLPGVVDEDEDRRPTVQMPLAAMFGTRATGVAMGTIMAPHGRRSSTLTVGLLHPRGRRVVVQLAELGFPLRPEWRVTQDHARRGLVVEVPATEDLDALVRWLVGAGAAVCTVPLTGAWQAEVHPAF
jgi:hypothetical protein